MSQELISIIMPVWKPDIKQLELCIESILNQTHSNLELIMIYKKNNNDIDNRVQDLIDRNKNDTRIRFIENDCSFIEALNLGIKLARGTKIGRIDGDDVCVNTRFEEQTAFMQKNNISLIGSWAYSMSDDGKVIGTIEPPHRFEDIRKSIMFHNPILHPSILMEKNMLDEIGYYDPSFFGAEDYELYLRAIARNYKIGNIPRYLIYLREANQSIMRGSGWKSTRRAYIKAKNKALLHYGLNNYYDIFFCFLTPLTSFISPKMAHKIKKILGWNKPIKENN